MLVSKWASFPLKIILEKIIMPNCLPVMTKSPGFLKDKVIHHFLKKLLFFNMLCKIFVFHKTVFSHIAAYFLGAV